MATATALPRHSRLAPWLDAVRHAVESMRQLPVNWDGEGGRPTDPEAVAVALDWLNEWASHGGDGESGEPFLTATPAGGVLFHWTASGHETLEIEFTPTRGTVETTYSLFNSTTRDSVSGTIHHPRHWHDWPATLRHLLTAVGGERPS